MPQYRVYLACYPPWLLSSVLSSESGFRACSGRIAPAVPANPRQKLAAVAQASDAPQRTCIQTKPSISHVVDPEQRNSPSPPSTTRSIPTSALSDRSPPTNSTGLSSPARPYSSRARVTPRVAVPLPFSDACVSNRIAFNSQGCRGISLGDWAKLAERGKTSLGIDDPHEPLDELLSSEDQFLFQSHWPGYDPRTCYLDLPAPVAAGQRAFTKVDVLDLVCQALVDWVLKITNCRQIECRESEWAIGLKQITFKHIYVTSVVEVKGYVSKWVPVLEIDPRAFQLLCQL